MRQGVALLCLALLFAPAGCAHNRTVPGGPKRELLGKVGIVAARDMPDVRMTRKPGGVAKAALKGFGEGFVIGAVAFYAVVLESEACLEPDCTAGSLLLGSAITGGISAIVGSIWSMVDEIRDIPAPQKVRILNDAGEVLSALRPSEELREAALEASSARPGCLAVRLRDEPSAPFGDPARHRSLSEKGIDTVLEIHVPSMGLEATEGGRAPRLVFFMQTRLRLVRAADGFELGSQAVDYRGDSHSFVDWTADTSTMLEQEYDIAVRRTGERIATELLCLPADSMLPLPETIDEQVPPDPQTQ